MITAMVIIANPKPRIAITIPERRGISSSIKKYNTANTRLHTIVANSFTTKISFT